MLGSILVKLYAVRINTFKKLIIKIIYRIEGGEFYSESLRDIMMKYYNVSIGMYTHGGCFNPYQFDPGTTIGRYCSIARTACAFNINHPMNYKSQHGFFFNPELNYCPDKMVYDPLEIGHDVWLGHNSIIMPNVQRIGDGAVVAAGAVVNKDVPPYAVLVGNPARIVRYRFSKETIEKLLAEKWWDKSMEEIMPNIHEYTNSYEDEHTHETDNAL